MNLDSAICEVFHGVERKNSHSLFAIAVRPELPGMSLKLVTVIPWNSSTCARHRLCVSAETDDSFCIVASSHDSLIPIRSPPHVNSSAFGSSSPVWSAAAVQMLVSTSWHSADGPLHAVVAANTVAARVLFIMFWLV